MIPVNVYVWVNSRAQNLLAMYCVCAYVCEPMCVHACASVCVCVHVHTCIMRAVGIIVSDNIPLGKPHACSVIIPFSPFRWDWPYPCPWGETNDPNWPIRALLRIYFSERFQMTVQFPTGVLSRRAWYCRQSITLPWGGKSLPEKKQFTEEHNEGNGVLLTSLEPLDPAMPEVHTWAPNDWVDH